MIYDEETARREVIRAGLELKKTGLIARTWGNVSARISETRFVITPSGRPYESLLPEDLVAVNIADASAAGPGRPSSEKGVHAAAYRLRPDAGFVVHTHQNYATMLSTLGRDTDGIPCAKYGMSGTETLSRHVAEALAAHPESQAVLMQNHGAVCLGRDYEDAFRAAFELEEKSEKIYRELCSALISQMPGGTEADLAGKAREREDGDRGTAMESYTRKMNSNGTILRLTSPYVRLAAEYGKDLITYIDDFGMMFGEKVRCLPPGSDEAAVMEALSENGGAPEGAVLVAARKGNPARAAGNNPGQEKNSNSEELFRIPDSALSDRVCLMRGGYAVCAAGNADDAEAMADLLEKNCQAQLLARSGARPVPVDPENARKEHAFYIEKYRAYGEK